MNDTTHFIKEKAPVAAAHAATVIAAIAVALIFILSVGAVMTSCGASAHAHGAQRTQQTK